MNRIVSVVVLSVLISCNDRSDEGIYKNLQSTLDSLSLVENGLVGFGVAIVNSDSVLYKRGLGYANLHDSVLYSTSTIQNVASISKTFIGVSLMKAQEEGLLNLNDPINRYLDFEVANPNYPDQPITIRHLATHTSSIRDNEFYSGRSYFWKDPKSRTNALLGVTFQEYSKFTMEAFLKEILTDTGKYFNDDSFLNKEPGAQFEYSNIGATLAALVLEKALGIPFHLYCKRSILEPLGMMNSGWSFDQVNIKKHSLLYMPNRKPIPFYSLITYPDGGLITSIDDLSKYLQELIRGYMGKGTILSQSSYQELFKPLLNSGHFNSLDPTSQNEGIFISIEKNSMLGHSGRDPGVSTYMHFEVSKGKGYIVFTNTELEEVTYEQYEQVLRKMKDSVVKE